MHERSLPASPNWYCSRCSDVSSGGLLGVGAKSIIYLIDVSASSCSVSGELVGHKDFVSGFSFCHHPGQSHICVSSSNDGSVRFWDSSTAALIREHTAHQFFGAVAPFPRSIWIHPNAPLDCYDAVCLNIWSEAKRASEQLLRPQRSPHTSASQRDPRSVLDAQVLWSQMEKGQTDETVKSKQPGDEQRHAEDSLNRVWAPLFGRRT